MRFQWFKRHFWIKILGHSSIFIVPLLFAQSNTIDRPYDLIQLKGSDLSAYVGQSISDIHCYAYNAALDDWQPIPFQIDEKDTSGSYFPSIDGALDTLDEVIFQATDLGDKALPGSWVNDQNAIESQRLEFRFDDPLSSGKTGWIYFYLSPTLASSNKRYIEYNPASDQVSTDIYDILHGPLGLISDISIKPSAGGDGVDFFDRQKFMIKLKLDIYGSIQHITLRDEPSQDFEFFNGLVKVHVNVTQTGLDVTENPIIRLNRKVRLSISGSVLGENFDESLTFNMQYYRTQTSLGTNKMTIPEIKYGSIKGTAERVIISADMDVSATGMRFFNPYNQDGSVRIDAEPDNIDHTLNWPGDNWALFAANPAETHPWAELTHASLMHIISLTGQSPAPSSSLYYDDGSYLAAPNETGDNFTFGDTGILLTGDITSAAPLSIAYSSYILPVNLTYHEGETLFGQHTHPLSRTMTNQRYAYPVTIAVDPLGGGSVTLDPPAEQAYEGTSMTATANESNPLYYFDHWTGTITSQSREIQWNASGPVQLTAHYLPYTQVTVMTSPENISYSVDGDEFEEASTFYKKPGETISIQLDTLQSAGVNARYHFVAWNAPAPPSFDMIIPHRDTLLTAAFMKEYRLNTSISLGGHGTMIPAPPGGWFEADSNVPVQAVVTGSDLFLGWKGSLSGTENPTTILMSGPKSVQAQFGNLPPIVSMADTSFLEDTSLLLPLSYLYEWIDDPNHADSLLAVQLSQGEHLNVSWDSENDSYLLEPIEPDWSGTDSLILSVTDPGGLIGQNKLAITVINDPDAPSAFALLTPDSGFVYSEWPESIAFSWEVPEDVDLNDALTYHFELDTTSLLNSPIHIQVDDLSDNSYLFQWPDQYLNWSYYWRVTAEDSYGLMTPSSVFSFHMATGVSDTPLANVPTTFVMDQNYPNPFNGRTIIRFGLPSASNVRLTIYNQKGQEIREMFLGELSPGYHEISWNGDGNNGLPVSSGVYLMVLNTNGKHLTQKALYLR